MIIKFNKPNRLVDIKIAGGILLLSFNYGCYRGAGKVIKKDQVSIDYENKSVRDGTYTFSVDKDKLTLIGGEGTVGGTYTLTRV